ncbi:hypothetical protein LZS85_15645 [Aliivibrio fischeri]|uniref:hypothetical protein n=1 Tax=Aliivibrio fischeri TaxID=668 RepID=UPI001F2174FC|nr:hypothetical protein [Aliivibrio fischeri]MCE7567557.1 hypothetical protein [Aliivibrio fischeri]
MSQHLENFRALATYFNFTSFDVAGLRAASTCEHTKAVSRILHNRLNQHSDLSPVEELYLLVKEGRINITSAMHFLDSVNYDLRSRIEIMAERAKSHESNLVMFTDFLKVSVGKTVKNVVGRIEEATASHQGDSYKRYRTLLGKLRTSIKHLKTCEVRKTSSILSKALIKTETKLKTVSKESEELGRMSDMYVDLYDSVTSFDANLPDESQLPTKGHFVIAIDAEETKKWAASLSTIIDKEELNRAVSQLLIETGELIRSNPVFIEGESSAVKVIKHGYNLASIEYQMICKECATVVNSNCCNGCGVKIGSA